MGITNFSPRADGQKQRVRQGIGKVFQGDVGSGDTPVMNR
jgi:hypothetical protein